MNQLTFTTARKTDVELTRQGSKVIASLGDGSFNVEDTEAVLLKKPWGKIIQFGNGMWTPIEGASRPAAQIEAIFLE